MVRPFQLVTLRRQGAYIDRIRHLARSHIDPKLERRISFAKKFAALVEQDLCGKQVVAAVTQRELSCDLYRESRKDAAFREAYRYLLSGEGCMFSQEFLDIFIKQWFGMFLPCESSGQPNLISGPTFSFVSKPSPIFLFPFVTDSLHAPRDIVLICEGDRVTTLIDLARIFEHVVSQVRAYRYHEFEIAVASRILGPRDLLDDGLTGRFSKRLEAILKKSPRCLSEAESTIVSCNNSIARFYDPDPINHTVSYMNKLIQLMVKKLLFPEACPSEAEEGRIDSGTFITRENLPALARIWHERFDQQDEA